MNLQLHADILFFVNGGNKTDLINKNNIDNNIHDAGDDPC